MAIDLSNLNSKQLHQAAAIREKIDALERELARVLDLTAGAPVTGSPARGGRTPAAPTPKIKRKFSKAARAKMAAAAKKRWAKAKAAGRNRL